MKNTDLDALIRAAIRDCIGVTCVRLSLEIDGLVYEFVSDEGIIEKGRLAGKTRLKVGAFFELCDQQTGDRFTWHWKRTHWSRKCRSTSGKGTLTIPDHTHRYHL